jgi:pentatricopeptide repeat protein
MQRATVLFLLLLILYPTAVLCGKNQSLIDLLEERLKRSESSESLRLRLINELVKCGRAEEAKRVALRGIRLNPKAFLLRKRLAEIYEKTGDPIHALSILKELLVERPEDRGVRSSLFNIYKRLNIFDKAIDELKMTPKDKEERWKDLFVLGLLYEELDRLEEAIEAFEEALEAKPNKKTILLRVGDLYYKTQQYKKAIQVYRKACELEPTNAGLYKKIGECYIGLGDTRKAKASWMKILEVSPGSYRMLANCYSRHSMINEAIDVYKLAREERCDQTIFALDLASLYRIQMRVEEAIQEYLIHLQKNPHSLRWIKRSLCEVGAKGPGLEVVVEVVGDFVRAHPKNLRYKRLLADLLMQIGRSDESISQYREIVHLKGDVDGKLLIDVGLELLSDERFEDAVKVFSVVTSLPSKTLHPNAYYNIGRCLRRLKRPGEARVKFCQVIENFPRHSLAEKAWFAIGEIDLSLGKTELARKTFSLILGDFPRTTLRDQIKAKIAKTYLLEGKLELARRLYKELLEKPHTSIPREEVLFWLGECLFMQGQIEDAQRKYEAISNGDPKSPFMNEALSRVLSFDEAGTRDEILRLSKVVFYSNTGEIERANKELASFRTEFPDSRLLKFGESELARAFYDKGMPDEALDVLLALSNRTRGSLFSAKCHLQTAEILCSEGRFEEAFMVLTKIKDDFPDTIFSSIARKKIKEIRHRLEEGQ